MNRKGFTLLEILLVSGILVILLAALMVASTEMRGIFYVSDVLATFQHEARLAVNSMTIDIKRTSLSQVTITQNYPAAGTDRLQFYLPADSDEDGEPDMSSGSLVWDPNVVTIEGEVVGTEMRLIRTQDADTEVLADNLKSITFIDNNIDSSLYMDEMNFILELEKTSGTGKTLRVVFTSVVNMRN
ncbi:MAG: prepilin-type N-terminal cleavage/methylation domain-containing protein [Candidatus Omnitrophota bacterium]